MLLCTTFVGLVPGHAYSVLEVKGEGLTKLVKLRNPWGKTEWQGFYGDNSWCWSLRSGLAEDLGIVHEDDGSFWMHLNDFCCYFDRVDTCHMLLVFHNSAVCIQEVTNVHFPMMMLSPYILPRFYSVG